MSKKFFVLIIPILIILSCSNKIKLSNNSKTNFVIILPQNADSIETKAANTFKKYFQAVTDAEIKITNQPSKNEQFIYLSTIKHNKYDFLKNNNITEDGFLIKTKDKNIYIIGNEMGVLYGVYTFFEKYVGVRWYNINDLHIPKIKNLNIPPINDLENPAFAYRTTSCGESGFPSEHSEFQDFLKLENYQRKTLWGMYVHTTFDLVPPKKYFKKHPEYFSEIGGYRVKDGQLCMSNPDVIKELIKNLAKKMKEKPYAKIWSVSQEDNYKYCTCKRCQQIAKEEGSQSGVYLRAVNEIAKHFPDKIISTLAYQFTRKPPKKTKPADNVNIMLCTIELNRNIPIEEDPGSKGFVEELKGWSKLTKNIFVWDYEVQFTNFLAPFPNLHTIPENIKLFKRNNVQGLFMQGIRNDYAEFAELKQYLIAHLMWDTSLCVDSLINDFLNGYYGDAGKYLKHYIDTMRVELLKSNIPLTIYGNPYDHFKGFLRPEMIKHYYAIFDSALKAVENNPKLYDRVLNEKLQLDYSTLEIAKFQVTGEWGIYKKNEKGEMVINSNVIKKLNNFIKTAKRLNVKYLNEKAKTLEDLKNEFDFIINNSFKNKIGLNKKVTILTTISPKYKNNNGPASLTDGILGVYDYHFNWLGFEENDMVAIIDLEKPTKINKIKGDFYQEEYSWIFLPKNVKFYISNDGKNFKLIKTVKNRIPLTKKGKFRHIFETQVNKKARYIKVVAQNIGKCPPWHSGSGGKAWIFCDEIIIE